MRIKLDNGIVRVQMGPDDFVINEWGRIVPAKSPAKAAEEFAAEHAAELGVEVPVYRTQPYRADFVFAVEVDAPEDHPALEWASDYERGSFVLPPNSHEWARTDEIAVDLLQRVSRRYVHPTLGEAWVVEADPHQDMLRERQERAERAAASAGRWLDVDD